MKQNRMYCNRICRKWKQFLQHICQYVFNIRWNISTNNICKTVHSVLPGSNFLVIQLVLITTTQLFDSEVCFVSFNFRLSYRFPLLISDARFENLKTLNIESREQEGKAARIHCYVIFLCRFNIEGRDDRNYFESRACELLYPFFKVCLF